VAGDADGDWAVAAAGAVESTREAPVNRVLISGWKRHSVSAAMTTTTIQIRAPADRRRDLGRGVGVATGGSVLSRLAPPRRGGSTPAA
jgi:hypothetical protein